MHVAVILCYECFTFFLFDGKKADVLKKLKAVKKRKT